MNKQWVVYLSGEIHTDWRDRIKAGTDATGLNVSFVSPVTDHAKSDDCGVDILGKEENNFWHGHKGAGVNAIRTHTSDSGQCLRDPGEPHQDG